jgi:hypothetical protein
MHRDGHHEGGKGYKVGASCLNNGRDARGGHPALGRPLYRVRLNAESPSGSFAREIEVGNRIRCLVGPVDCRWIDGRRRRRRRGPSDGRNAHGPPANGYPRGTSPERSNSTPSSGSSSSSRVTHQRTASHSHGTLRNTTSPGNSANSAPKPLDRGVLGAYHAHKGCVIDATRHGNKYIRARAAR